MVDPYAIPQVHIPEGVIHLGIGQPGADLLPGKEISAAWRDALNTDETFFLSYGEERGNLNFRQTLARFLSKNGSAEVDPEHLMITNGNSQALDFICSRFTNPGDTILVEDPSYFLALKIFADHHLNIIGLPMDDEGIITENLSEIIDQHRPKLIYTIPTHHNPVGISASRKRRKELVRICNNQDLLVVADEVYHYLTFEGSLPMPMGAFCSQGAVISLGSFSKILAPGLRLGWLQADPSIIETLEHAGVIISGGGFNPFTSQMVETFIRSGQLEHNIRELNKVYQHRMATLCDAVETFFDNTVGFVRPKGGYFVWLALPGGMDAGALRETAIEEKVDFYAGHLFSSSKKMRHFIRLAFSFYHPRDIEKGIRRLHRAIQRTL